MCAMWQNADQIGDITDVNGPLLTAQISVRRISEAYTTFSHVPPLRNHSTTGDVLHGQRIQHLSHRENSRLDR